MEKMKKLKALIEILRPKQWIKNGFVFAGIIFSQNIFNFPYLIKTILAFISFCLISSSVYIINDIKDKEADKLHPKKRKRPLPSGRLKSWEAFIFFIFIFAGSIALALKIGYKFGYVVLSYFFLNLFYTLLLKKIVIVDILTIAFGFVLRALGGVVAINVDFSPWLFISTLTLSIFLGLAKRRAELIGLEENAHKHRKTLKEYTLPFMDQLISISVASTLIAYSIYTVSPETISKFGREIMLTTVFVIYGLFRYLYLVYIKHEGDAPEKIVLKDKSLILGILLWGITAFLCIYL